MAALAAAWVAGWAAAGEGPPPALRVALPPGPGVVRGFDRDLFAAVASEVGAAFVPVDAPPADALRDLDAGIVDVAAGPYPPRQAGRRVLLRPVTAAGETLLKRVGDGAIRTFGDAEGKRLAALPTSGNREPVGSRARASGAAHGGPGLSDPYADLAAGRVAALIGPAEAVAAAALARPGTTEVVGPAPASATPVAPAVRAGDPREAQWDDAIRRLRDDGRLAAIQRRWFGYAFDLPGPP